MKTEITPHFSFLYGSESSDTLLKNWDTDQTEELHPDYMLETSSWTDPQTGLRIVLETKRYSAHNALEWVAHIENTGIENSLLIENFQIADLLLDLGENTGDNVFVAHSKGTDIRVDDFLFLEKKLNPSRNLTFAPDGGRSSSGECMPYFNLHDGKNGYILSVGWTGQWQASFQRGRDGVQVSAGMEETHFVLYPGESVRTPSFAVLRWQGSETESYNLWRAFMLDQHTPKNEQGAVVTLPLTCGAWGGDTVENHKNTISRISAMNYDFDAYWVDAGWFGEESRHSADQYGDEWFKNAGDWYHNPILYPQGLRPVSDAAHAAGMDFLLWFEPERAWCDSEIVRQHGDWFLKAGAEENTSYLFNMGNEEARVWMTDFISEKISEYGVDIYRQDFNVAPLPYWKANDAENRIGITEMKYIEGLYAYLEGLQEKHPRLLLDNCAGGGRRLDYEILTRALPLFRSDYQCFDTYETTPCQVQTDGLSRWVPLSGTCVQYRPGDTYSFRSNLAYAVQCPATEDLLWQTKMISEFHRAQPYFTGAYYCLTEGDVRSNAQWYAYQMDRPDLDGGFVMAFRREDALDETITLRVHVPEGASQITFTDADSGESRSLPLSGEDTVEISIAIRNPKESRLIFYNTIYEGGFT